MNDAERLEALLAFVTDEARVCPRPVEWNRLYELIGGKRTDFHDPWRVVWEPAPPLILAAWSARDEAKAARFREHIKWAADCGAIEAVDSFLRSLPLEAWHHSNPLKPHY